MDSQPHFAIATVTTENYFQWTMTMLYSFVKSNPWFRGDILLISKDLPPEMINDLSFFHGLKLIRPSDELLKQTELLAVEIPKFMNLSARFYSLEVFRIAGYDKILYLDSDMLVVQSIEEVFHLPNAFYASAQLCIYKGKGRNGSTFYAEMNNQQADFLESPVNTGFMLIDGELFNQNHYQGLVDLIKPVLWSRNNLEYTDELIINVYFKDKISLLDTRYNYRARAARSIKEKEHLVFEDAKIIHFYAKFKPWNFDEMLASTTRNANWIKAYELWYKWYIEFLKFYHFQKKMLGVAKFKNSENE